MHSPQRAADEVKPIPKKIVAILYYPNNYSGVDDSGEQSKVNPIHYLMNGIGTQEYVTESVCLQCGHKWYPTEDELRETVTGGKNLKNLRCPNCGSIITGNFCTECGTKKPEATAEKTCPKCGTKVDPNAKFCVNCGNSLE